MLWPSEWDRQYGQINLITYRTKPWPYMARGSNWLAIMTSRSSGRMGQCHHRSSGCLDEPPTAMYGFTPFIHMGESNILRWNRRIRALIFLWLLVPFKLFTTFVFLINNITFLYLSEATASIFFKAWSIIFRIGSLPHPKEGQGFYHRLCH